MVSADGQDAEFFDDEDGTQCVGAFVDDIAGLVERIASTDEAELVDHLAKFVRTAVHITDVESTFCQSG